MLLVQPMEVDVHTHSISSGHYSADSITAMVKAARHKQLKLLGISEHGPALPGSCTTSYFRGLMLAPPVRMGVKMLYGAELNILDSAGTLDLEQGIMARLDYCLAGMHLPCYHPGNRTENTRAYLAAMKNPAVQILAHPDDGKFPADYEELVRAAAAQRVILEINNSSLTPGSYRGEASMQNCRIILELCEKYRHPILLSSDSHGAEHVGDFTYAGELLRKTGFPAELILNGQMERFLNFLEK